MASTGIAYLPGLARPVVIDSTDLSGEEAAELEQLVRDASFFELPAEVGPSGVPDARQHVMTVDSGERQHTVRVCEPVEDPALQALLTFLRGKMRERRTR
jgi:hypothetical protein